MPVQVLGQLLERFGKELCNRAVSCYGNGTGEGDQGASEENWGQQFLVATT